MYLLCFDDKRYVLDDEIRTLAYFHKDSATSCKGIQKDCKTIAIIEKNCDNWKRLWLKKIQACKKMNLVIM